MIHYNGRKWRGTKESLDEGERGEWKVGLKLDIHKTKIMASSPITSQQIEGEKVEAVTNFIFLGTKITADSDCNHEIKELALWNENYDKTRQCIKKQRHYLANKGPYSQIYSVTIVMYGWDSWTIKKAECWRIDTFEVWCWRRLLRFPWTARRSNQSILKEINPEYSLEGLMLKLKLQYFGHLIWRADSLEKTLMLGKIEGRRRGWQNRRWLDDITISMDMILSNLQEMVKHKEAWHVTVHGVAKRWTWLSDWTT